VRPEGRFRGLGFRVVRVVLGFGFFRFVLGFGVVRVVLGFRVSLTGFEGVYSCAGGAGAG
jgi:hypothetical protein